MPELRTVVEELVLDIEAEGITAASWRTLPATRNAAVGRIFGEQVVLDAARSLDVAV